MTRSSARVLVAFVAGALIVSGPQAAIAAFDAVNADKVDGKHAVGAGATPSGRAGKLVATNSAGRLPSNIIAKAPNSELLDGIDSSGLQRAYTRTVVVNRASTAAASGAALKNAIAQIVATGGTRSASNRWLVKIEPGTYDISPTTLTLSDWIDLEGSGPGTILTCSCVGAYGPASATVNVPQNVAGDIELRDLTITNTGGSGSYDLGIYAPGNSDTLGTVTLRDVDVDAFNATTKAYGIVAVRGLRMERGSIDVAGAPDTLALHSSHILTIIGSEITASATTNAVAITLAPGVTGAVIRDSLIRAAALPGQTAYGVNGASNAGIVIEHSWVRATSGAVRRAIFTSGTTTVNVANTGVEGSVVGNGTETCVGAYNASYVALSTTCQ